MPAHPAIPPAIPTATCISVIIVSYNVADRLADCLASLPRDADITVVDNASTDASVDLVRRQFPWVRLIAQAENLGFSQAVNRGVAASCGGILLILNPDAELPSGGLDALRGALLARPESWALGPRQVDAEGHLQLSWGWRPSLAGELWRRTLQRRLDRGQHGVGRWLDRRMASCQPVAWMAGSCLLVWRWAFERVGGFDERYFLYFEDIDFCLRLRAAGGSVLYEPAVTVLHHRGQSAATAPGPAAAAYRRSQLLFWAWHRGPWMAALVGGYLAVSGRRPPVD